MPTEDRDSRVTGLLAAGGLGVAAGLVVFIASSGNPPNQTGQVGGVLVGLAGLGLFGGGLWLQARPELLSMRVTVAPTYQGGLVLATGQF